MAENLANDYESTLSSGITAGDTSLVVASATGAPSANFRIRINNEIMLVTNVAGTTYTVTRAQEGTTAAAHSAGAAVAHVMTKEGLDKYALESFVAFFPGATSGKVINVPASHQMVVVEELLVEGELVIDGSVYVLTPT